MVPNGSQQVAQLQTVLCCLRMLAPKMLNVSGQCGFQMLAGFTELTELEIQAGQQLVNRGRYEVVPANTLHIHCQLIDDPQSLDRLFSC